MTKRARRNYVRAFGQRKDKKIMHKVRTKWTVFSLSAIFLAGLGFSTTGAHASVTQKPVNNQNNNTQTVQKKQSTPTLQKHSVNTNNQSANNKQNLVNSKTNTIKKSYQQNNAENNFRDSNNLGNNLKQDIHNTNHTKISGNEVNKALNNQKPTVVNNNLSNNEVANTNVSKAKAQKAVSVFKSKLQTMPTLTLGKSKDNSNSNSTKESPSLINNLVNIVDSNINNGTSGVKYDNAKNGFKNLMQILSPANLSQIESNGKGIGNTSDTIASHSWLGDLNSAISDINAINANGDNKDLNALSQKANSLSGSLHNSLASMGISMYNLSHPNISFNDIALRFEQPGTIHGLLQKNMPNENLSQIGGMINTLNTIKSNPIARGHYNNVVNDLAKMPGETKAQEAYTLQNVSSEVNNIVNHSGITNISGETNNNALDDLRKLPASVNKVVDNKNTQASQEQTTINKAKSSEDNDFGGFFNSSVTPAFVVKTTFNRLLGSDSDKATVKDVANSINADVQSGNFQDFVNKIESYMSTIKNASTKDSVMAIAPNTINTSNLTDALSKANSIKSSNPSFANQIDDLIVAFNAGRENPNDINNMDEVINKVASHTISAKEGLRELHNDITDNSSLSSVSVFEKLASGDQTELSGSDFTPVPSFVNGNINELLHDVTGGPQTVKNIFQHLASKDFQASPKKAHFINIVNRLRNLSSQSNSNLASYLNGFDTDLDAFNGPISSIIANKVKGAIHTLTSGNDTTSYNAILENANSLSNNTQNNLARDIVAGFHFVKSSNNNTQTAFNKVVSDLSNVTTNPTNSNITDNLNDINHQVQTTGLHNIDLINDFASDAHKEATNGDFASAPSFKDNSLNNLLNSVLGNGHTLQTVIAHATNRNFRSSSDSANLLNALSTLKNLPAQNQSTINTYLSNLASNFTSGKFHGNAGVIANKLHSTLTNIVAHDDGGAHLNYYADNDSNPDADLVKDIVAGYNFISKANPATKNAYQNIIGNFHKIANTTSNSDGKNASITSALNSINNAINGGGANNHIKDIDNSLLTNLGNKSHTIANNYVPANPTFANDDFNNILTALAGNNLNFQGMVNHLASNSFKTSGKATAFRNIVSDLKGLKSSTNVNNFLGNINTQLGSFTTGLGHVIANKLQNIISDVHSNTNGSYASLADYAKTLSNPLEKGLLNDLAAGHKLANDPNQTANNAYISILNDLSNISTQNLDKDGKSLNVSNDVKHINNTLYNAIRNDNRLNLNLFNKLEQSSKATSSNFIPNPTFKLNTFDQLLNNLSINPSHINNDIKSAISHIASRGFKESNNGQAFNAVLNAVKNVNTDSKVSDFLKAIRPNLTSRLSGIVNNILSHDTDGSLNGLVEYANGLNVSDKALTNDIGAAYNLIKNNQGTADNIVNDLARIENHPLDAQGKNINVTSDLEDVRNDINSNPSMRNATNGILSGIASSINTIHNDFVPMATPTFADSTFNALMMSLLGSGRNVEDMSKHLASNEFHASGEEGNFNAILNDIEGASNDGNVNDLLNNINSHLNNFNGPLSHTVATHLKSVISNVVSHDDSGNIHSFTDYVDTLNPNDKSLFNDLGAGYDLLRNNRSNTSFINDFHGIINDIKDIDGQTIDVDGRNHNVSKDLNNIRTTINNDAILSNNTNGILTNLAHGANNASNNMDVLPLNFQTNNFNTLLNNLARQPYSFNALIKHLTSNKFPATERTSFNNILDSFKNIQSDGNVNDLLNNIKTNLVNFRGPISQQIANHVQQLITNVEAYDKGGNSNAIADYADSIKDSDNIGSTLLDDIASGYNIVHSDGTGESQRAVNAIVDNIKDIDNQKLDNNGKSNRVEKDLNNIASINNPILNSQVDGLLDSVSSSAHGISHNFHATALPAFADNTVNNTIQKLVGSPYTLSKLVGHLISNDFQNSGEKANFNNALGALKDVPSDSNFSEFLDDIDGTLSGFHGPVSSQIAGHLHNIISGVENYLDGSNNMADVASYANIIKSTNPIDSALINDLGAGYDFVKQNPNIDSRYRDIFVQMQNITNQKADANGKNNVVVDDMENIANDISENDTLHDLPIAQNLDNSMLSASNNFDEDMPHLVDDRFNELLTNIYGSNYSMDELAQHLMSKEFKNSGEKPYFNDILNKLGQIHGNTNINDWLNSFKNDLAHFNGPVSHTMANYMTNIINDTEANDGNGSVSKLTDYADLLMTSNIRKASIISDLAAGFYNIKRAPEATQNNFAKILKDIADIDNQVADPDNKNANASNDMQDISNIIKGDSNLTNPMIWNHMFTALKDSTHQSANDLMPKGVLRFKDDEFGQILNKLANSYNVYKLASHLASANFKASGEQPYLDEILTYISYIPTYNNINDLLDEIRPQLNYFHGPVSQVVANRVIKMINDMEANDDHGHSMATLADYANSLHGTNQWENDLINDFGSGYQLIRQASPQVQDDFDKVIRSFDDIMYRNTTTNNKSHDIAKDLNTIGDTINGDSVLKNSTNGLLSSLATSAKKDAPEFEFTPNNNKEMNSQVLIKFLNKSKPSDVVNEIVTFGNDKQNFDINSYDNYVPSGYVIKGINLSDNLQGSNVTKFRKGTQVVNVLVSPKAVTDTIDYRIGNIVKNTEKLTIKVNGTPGDTFNTLRDLPKGYKLNSNTDKSVAYDGKKHIIYISSITPTPKNVTDIIDYRIGNPAKNTEESTIKVNGKSGDTFNAISKLPKGYKLDNNADKAIAFDGNKHIVYISSTAPNKPTVKTLTDTIDYRIGNATKSSEKLNVKVNGKSDTTYNALDKLPKGYKLDNNADKAIAFDGKTHVVYISSTTPNKPTPKNVTDVIDYRIGTPDKNTEKLTVNVNGKSGSTFNAIDDLPKGYKLDNNTDKAIAFDGNKHVVYISSTTPNKPTAKTLTDTIDYRIGNASKSSEKLTVHVNGKTSDTFNATDDLPKGYKLDNNADKTIAYDGKTHVVYISSTTPNKPTVKTLTDTIDYRIGDASKNSEKLTVHVSGKSNTTYNALSQLPSGYKLNNNADKAIAYDGKTHVVYITSTTPNKPTAKTMTDTIDYRIGNASKSSEKLTIHVNGKSNTTYNALSQLPSGYKLDNDADKAIAYDGKTHVVYISSTTPNKPNKLMTDTIDYRVGNAMGSSEKDTIQVKGYSNTTYNALVNMPSGYKLNNDADEAIAYDGKTHIVYITSTTPNKPHKPTNKLMTDTIDYRIGNVSKSSEKDTIQVKGCSNTAYNALVNMPSGYKLNNDADEAIAYDGKTHIVYISSTKPNKPNKPSVKTLTDVIDYRVGNATKSYEKATIHVNGKANSTFDALNELPSGYKLNNNTDEAIAYDGKTHVVYITATKPNEPKTKFEIDTIDYRYGTPQGSREINTIQVIGDKGTTYNALSNMPVGYNVLYDNADKEIAYDGGKYTVYVGINRPNKNENTPVIPINPNPQPKPQPKPQNNEVTDIINFTYNNRSVWTTTAKGNRGNDFDVIGKLPYGYKLAGYANPLIKLENIVHNVAVVPTVAPHHNPNVPNVPNVQPVVPKPNIPNNNGNNNAVTPNHNNVVPNNNENNVPINWWDTPSIPTIHNNKKQNNNNNSKNINNKNINRKTSHNNKGKTYYFHQGKGNKGYVRPKLNVPISKLKVGHVTHFDHMTVKRIKLSRRYLRADGRVWLHDSLNFHTYNHVATVLNHGQAKLLRLYLLRTRSGHEYLRAEVKIDGHKLFANYVHFNRLYIHRHHSFYVYAKRTIGEHTIRHFTLHNIRHYVRHGWARKYRILHVRKVVRVGKYDMTRLLLTNGRFITANKNYVKVIK